MPPTEKIDKFLQADLSTVEGTSKMIDELLNHFEALIFLCCQRSVHYAK
jgi:hypothetical protein